MQDVFIVSAVRTPVGKRNGYLREAVPAELLGQVLDEVIDRVDLDPNLVEDVMNGTVYQVGEQGFTLGRNGVFASKLPDTVPGDIGESTMRQFFNHHTDGLCHDCFRNPRCDHCQRC